MNKVTQLLKDAGTFYLATVEGDQPRVRPFGAAAEINGATYICLNNQKKAYQQMLANPKVEICGMIGQATWFRLYGTAIRDDSVESREEFLNQNPSLRDMYKADDGLYEVFRLVNPHGAVESFSDPKEEF